MKRELEEESLPSPPEVVVQVDTSELLRDYRKKRHMQLPAWHCKGELMSMETITSVFNGLDLESPLAWATGERQRYKHSRRR